MAAPSPKYRPSSPFAAPAYDLALSSIGDSSFISESGHMDSESKATTPSASPKMIESRIYPDVPDSAGLTDEADDAREEFVNGSASPDDDEDDRSVHSAVPRVAIGWRLRDIASRLRNFKNAPPQSGTATPDPDKDNITTLQRHVEMMEWVSGLLNQVPSETASSIGEEPERFIYIPKLHGVKWRDFVVQPPPHVPTGDEPTPHTHYAVSFLDGEFPNRRRVPGANWFEEIEEAPPPIDVASGRPEGVKSLPPVIHVNSLATRRLLASVTEVTINVDAPRGQLVIYRPYKILVHFDDQIRRQFAEIEDLISKAGRGPPARSGDANADSLREKNEGIKTENVTGEKESDTSGAGKPLPRISLFRPARLKEHTYEELQEARADFAALVEFMDKFLSPLCKALKDAKEMRVSFNELWHLYMPGSLVYVKDPGVPQKLWRVIQGTDGRVGAFAPILHPTHPGFLKLGGRASASRASPMRLDCYYVDFNGTHYVRVLKRFQIEPFKEFVSIRGLSILPLNVAETEGLVDIEDLRRQSEDFLSYTKPSYCYFRGRSYVHEPEGTLMRRPADTMMGSVAVLSEAIESPVVVDFERCLQTIPDWKPCREPRELFSHNKDIGPPPSADDDRVWDLRIAEKVLNYTDQSQSLEWYSRSPPTGDEVLLLPNRVFVFVLRTRRWASIPLGAGNAGTDDHSLTRMTADPSAWDSLQIDQNHRSIIQSLMATHFRKNKSERRQFDLIRDKGKGLIVLLHGVPGVGKTSTAETVAQYYNKPLLPITCGDLGMSPNDVESKLQHSFQLAQAWECVLLLDEADVFLAERSQDNIERNALVSVFLRVMEYYEGILFLTTNKVGSFDEAFKSRMSMALYYPPLKQDQTERIWAVQLERTEKLSVEAAPDDVDQHVQFDRVEIMTFANKLWMLQDLKPEFKPVWNGRQIRNAFQTAVALAEWHQKENNIKGLIKVKGEHFAKVAQVSNDFNKYLWEVKKQRTDEALAFKKAHRFDQFISSQLGGGTGNPGQQQTTGLGGWDGSMNAGMMGFGGQTGTGMAGPGFGGGGMQPQGGFVSPQSWQSGFGGMTGNATNMGSGMHPGGVNVQVMPGQSIAGLTDQQQTPSTNPQQGGSMQAMFGQSSWA
ncbi:hypothetical protein CGCA056_v014281 [Colletotrichum aenigma]|uniref:uncharacterized protein n=1 Tax=Colletotrichum aenigma TaxID=1215731 RepID=UPI001872AF30|nr:uncharacterized protein CGCA056_v014281 [Colletotrichum aenigma]KAF5502464.1 hypothetical protein CGCA056_v014281 [Colletotrichum aenigma]